MDLFDRTKTEFHHGQADFLNRELNTCSLYLDLAYKSHEQEDKTSAAQAKAYAENSYATVLRLMSDPQYIESLAVEVGNDFKQQMDLIRKALEGLQLKEMDRPSETS
jgi:hypothetical protein